VFIPLKAITRASVVFRFAGRGAVPQAQFDIIAASLILCLIESLNDRKDMFRGRISGIEVFQLEKDIHATRLDLSQADQHFLGITSEPAMEIVWKLANYFDISVETLVDGDASNPYDNIRLITAIAKFCKVRTMSGQMEWYDKTEEIIMNDRDKQWQMGYKIASRRSALGLSQEALAEAVGISRVSIEQKIMSAIVQVDMFLVDCWRWLLAILALFGLFALAYIYSSRH